MNKNTESTTSVLPRSWQDLPQIFHDRLGKQAGAQRAMFHDGHLLLILHDVPESGAHERKGLFFWRAPDGSWKTSQGGGFIRLTEVVDRYAKRVDALEELVTHAQDASALFDALKRGSPLRRAAANLTRALQQAREAVGGRDVIAQRDRAQEVMLAAELLLTDAKHALDYRMARQAEAQAQADREQAENSAKLNRLAAFFLPLTLLASLFGMKLPSGLETDSPIAFWAVVVGGLTFGYLVGQLSARKRTTPS